MSPRETLQKQEFNTQNTPRPRQFRLQVISSPGKCVIFPLVQCIPRNTKQPGTTLKNSQLLVKCLKKTNRNLIFNLLFVVSPSVPAGCYDYRVLEYARQILLYLIIYIKRGFTLEQRLFLASPQLLKHYLIHRLLVLAKKFCLSLC